MIQVRIYEKDAIHGNILKYCESYNSTEEAIAALNKIEEDLAE